MTRLQIIRDRIAHLENRYALLHYQKGVLERAWSESVKVAIPKFQKEMDVVLNALRDAEAEEHRIVWPRMQRRART
jgi:hypothetical protein